MAEITKSKKEKKEYVFLGIFIVIMIVLGFIIIKYLVLSESPAQKKEAMVRPTYLKQSIPNVKKIKDVVNDPKFREMTYMKSFFAPVEVKKQGRPNPFVPFSRPQEKKGEE